MNPRIPGQPDPHEDSALLKGAQQLADGQRLDSADLAGLDPELAAGLQQIEALALGFGALAQTPLSPQLSRGTHFGPLEILDVLGQGGYGTVYRAYDPQLEREVALKVPDQQSAGHAALLREGQLLARIDHPNVLKVHGVVEHEGRIGFCIELLRGESLEQWAQKQGAAGAGELVTIGTALCAALAALHREGVVHGDVKPANVLRHAEGRWVLADFGSGQLAWNETCSSGTPAYMAPERLQGDASTAASDQYSLGVLLFRIAVGRCPADAPDAARLAALLAAGQREGLLDARPDLPAALVAVIERAMAYAPAQRHASCGALAGALQAAWQTPSGESARALPGASAARQLDWRWPTLAAAIALLSVGVALWPRQRPQALTTEAAADSVQAVWLGGTDAGEAERPLASGSRIAPGQTLALHLTLAAPQHVYVFNEDSQGERFQLFPLAESELDNPLPAGTTRLPGMLDGQALRWRVTSAGGRERFVVLLASGPVAELEGGIATQASAARSGMALAERTERGVGGLELSNPDQGGDWLTQLTARHPQLKVAHFELRNRSPRPP